MISSHARDTEARAVEWSDRGFATDRQAESQYLSRIPGINQTVIPEPCRGVKRGRLSIELIDDLLLHRLELCLVDRTAGAPLALLGDDRQHLRRLLAAHHRDTVVGPGEDEARII